MATLNSNWTNIGERYLGNWGYGDTYYRVYGKLNSQDVSASRSNVTLEMRSVASANYSVTYNTYGYINGATVMNNQVLQYRTNEITIGSTTFDIQHDNNGNVGTTNIYTELWANGTTTPGRRGLTVGFELPSINRYSNITNHYVSDITVNSSRVYWNTDRSVDYVQTSINGSGWQNVNSSDTGTSGSYPMSGLNYNTTYSVRTRVRNSSSGLWTESGTINFTTRDICKITSYPTEITIGDTINVKSSNPGGCVRHLVITYNNIEIISRTTGITDNYNLILTEDEKNILYKNAGTLSTGTFKIVLKSFYNSVKIGEDSKTVSVKWAYNAWVKPGTTWIRAIAWGRLSEASPWRQCIPWVKVGSIWKVC